MKKCCFLIIILFSVSFTFAQTDSIQPNKNIFTIVEKMPSWRGCEKELNEDKKNQCTFNGIQQYIKKNLKYPAVSKQQKLQGTVYVKFVIDNNGEATNIEVVNGISQEINDEAIRLITNMPQWNPGVQRGKIVDVQYSLPIKFSLQNAK